MFYFELRMSFWEIVKVGAIFAAAWAVSANLLGSDRHWRNSALGCLGALSALVLAQAIGVALGESDLRRWAIEFGGVLVAVYSVERFA